MVKHIKNKHAEAIDETYAKESTKEWLNKTIQHKLRKQMRQNYLDDLDKLLNQPGNRSKYSGAPKGRHSFKSDDSDAKKFPTRAPYLDRDDPSYNQKSQNKS